MPGAKIVVLYPTPKDLDAFERAYTKEHAPMVTPQTFKGMTKFVASRIVGTPDNSKPQFCRIAELHFPSMDVLKAAAVSSPAQQAVQHAISISTGGTPVFLVAEEDVRQF